MSFDLVIKGGTVVDGTRLPRVVTDVGIRDGLIAKVGRIEDPGNAQVLDADGLIVAPGFVDLHCHYDAQVFWDPYCTISGWHGVTSLVMGNCGFGFAPVKPELRDRSLLMMTRNEQIPYESMKAGMRWDWETFPEWMDSLERLPKGVNVVSYVPLNPLLIYVMGLEGAKSGRPCSPEEQARMKDLLREAMLKGAGGFSFQRFGKHSLQADYDGTPMPTDLMSDDDIFACADVLRELDAGVIQLSQAKGESGDIFADASGESVNLSAHPDFKFTEELAARAMRPVLWNAVAPVIGSPSIHRNILKWLEDCNRRGLRVYGQGSNVRSWYQFALDLWNLYDSSPAWNRAMQGTLEERLANLEDPDLVAQMIAEDGDIVTLPIGGPTWKLTVVNNGGNSELDKYVGRTLGEIATEEGRHHVEVMVDLSRRSHLQIEFRSGSLCTDDPDEMTEMVVHPLVVPGVSDGGAHIKFFTGGSYPTDLISWLVRDTGRISLEEAHWHLSYLPAQFAGMPDRGFLREGAPADIVVYDLENLHRVPDFEFEIAYDFPADDWRRVQRAEGYRWILVNGEITFEDGECTGATPGKLIRSPIGVQAVPA